ncbi:MAG: hypothetical protein HY436_01195, partial [Candidatus Liptonbacteria bacterium]|nr:hypothetical protein [Candidatus Liptonbacteria bacterium]
MTMRTRFGKIGIAALGGLFAVSLVAPQAFLAHAQERDGRRGTSTAPRAAGFCAAIETHRERANERLSTRQADIDARRAERDARLEERRAKHEERVAEHRTQMDTRIAEHLAKLEERAR